METLNLRFLLKLMLAASVALAIGAGCSGSSRKRVFADVSEKCTLNSNCQDPLVCAFERCHEQCEISRDCPADQRCVLTEDDFHVCQLPDENECEDDRDCRGSQLCGVDAECRDECDAASDCVEGQACSYGTCADKVELTSDDALPIERGHEPEGVGGSAGASASGGEAGSDGSGGHRNEGGSPSGGTRGSEDGGASGSDHGGSAGARGGGVSAGESGGPAHVVSGGTSGADGSEGGSAGAPSGPVCGDGVVAGEEECDDGDASSGDGCSSACKEEDGWTCSGEPTRCVDIDECQDSTAPCDDRATCTNTDGAFTCECDPGYVGNGFTCQDRCDADPESCSLPVEGVAAGDSHTCALLTTGAVRCWGYGGYGQLGYGNSNTVGDDESPTEDVNIGGSATQIAAGPNHTCALLTTGAVRCWGYNAYGQLGYGNTDNVGDNEDAAFAGDVDVGGTVKQIATGYYHTCAVLTTGAVRCWGYGAYGGLGYGNTTSIGDGETPATAGNVTVGGTVRQVVAGSYHTCALLSSGDVVCWGYGAYGQLGYGNTTSVGDDETPASVGSVDVGGTVVQIAAGEYHTCALLETGAVRCWGYNNYGQLGYGNTNNVGDGETPDFAGDVLLGGDAQSVACGRSHTCAVLTNGTVRCWGYGYYGALGYGDTENIGDDETPEDAGDVDVGDTVEQIVGGGYHTCALTAASAVRCWGRGASGVLGYGNSDSIGDDEAPSTAGIVSLL
jgi:cysteine-rich repeat protein